MYEFEDGGWWKVDEAWLAHAKVLARAAAGEVYEAIKGSVEHMGRTVQPFTFKEKKVDIPVIEEKDDEKMEI